MVNFFSNFICFRQNCKWDLMSWPSNNCWLLQSFSYTRVNWVDSLLLFCTFFQFWGKWVAFHFPILNHLHSLSLKQCKQLIKSWAQNWKKKKITTTRLTFSVTRKLNFYYSKKSDACCNQSIINCRLMTAIISVIELSTKLWNKCFVKLTRSKCI